MNLEAKNVLVFPCGSECGLEIDKALKYEKYVNLFGVSSSSENHGPFVYENYIRTPVPIIGEPDFINKFNALLSEYKIDYVFPATDGAAIFLTENTERITARIISAPYETNFICRSKKRTYDLLAGIVTTPKMYDVDDVTDNMLPVFLKPEIGQIAQGTVLAADREMLEYHTAKSPDLLVLEYLPGYEYTVDCFTDRHGKLRFCSGRRRCRTRSGLSVNSIRVRDDRFIQWGEKINAAITFRGGWFFQIKQNSAGEFVLMEVSPRIAGTSALARNRGVNLPLLSFYDAMDMDVEILENDFDNEIDRALTNRFRINYRFEHAYVDFDDCLVVRGKVNSQLLAFLYDCVNAGKKIYLLTRHADDINDSLAKYRLAGLFDEIIHIGRDESKSKYVTRRPAIFIDDSFGERKDVAASGTAVFTPDVANIVSL